MQPQWLNIPGYCVLHLKPCSRHKKPHKTFAGALSSTLQEHFITELCWTLQEHFILETVSNIKRNFISGNNYTFPSGTSYATCPKKTISQFSGDMHAQPQTMTDPRKFLVPCCSCYLLFLNWNIRFKTTTTNSPLNDFRQLEWGAYLIFVTTIATAGCVKYFGQV